MLPLIRNCLRTILITLYTSLHKYLLTMIWYAVNLLASRGNNALQQIRGDIMGYFTQGTSYNEAMDLAVTRDEARGEVLEHGLEWCDFIEDEGDLPEYKGAQVLAWLGY